MKDTDIDLAVAFIIIITGIIIGLHLLLKTDPQIASIVSCCAVFSFMIGYFIISIRGTSFKLICPSCKIKFSSKEISIKNILLTDPYTAQWLCPKCGNGYYGSLFWVEEPLWDTEIIPVDGIDELILFDRPVGQTFRFADKIICPECENGSYKNDSMKTFNYSSLNLPRRIGRPNEFKLKDIAIGFPQEIDKIDEDIILNGWLSLTLDSSKIIRTVELKDCRIFRGINKEFRLLKVFGGNFINLDKLRWELPTNEIICHIKGDTAIGLEIKWPEKIRPSKPIYFSVFLLGLYGFPLEEKIPGNVRDILESIYNFKKGDIRFKDAIVHSTKDIK